MRTLSLNNNQTYADAVIAACGTLEAAMAVMLANSTSLTANPTPGTTLTVPANATTDTATLQYFNRNGIVPATLS